MGGKALLDHEKLLEIIKGAQEQLLETSNFAQPGEDRRGQSRQHSQDPVQENSASSNVKGVAAINSLFNPTPRREDAPDILGVVDNTLSPEGSSFQAVPEFGSSLGLGNTRGLSTAGHFGDHKRIST